MLIIGMLKSNELISESWSLILKCYHYFISLYVTYFRVKIKTMQIEEKLAEGLFETENSSKIHK